MRWSAASFLLAKLGKKTELLCHPALLQHSSSSDRKNSIHHALHRNFSLPFSPSSSWHNYVSFLSSQGPVFSFTQDSSWEAQPWCFLKMVTDMCLLFVAVLTIPIFTLLLDKFSCCQKKCNQPWNFHRAVQRSFQGDLSTCLYCNWSLSQLVWKCVENTSCSHSFYSFIIVKGELSLCQTHLNIFILLSIYVYSCILTSTFSERWGTSGQSLVNKNPMLHGKNSKTLCEW